MTEEQAVALYVQVLLKRISEQAARTLRGQNDKPNTKTVRPRRK